MASMANRSLTSGLWQPCGTDCVVVKRLHLCPEPVRQAPAIVLFHCAHVATPAAAWAWTLFEDVVSLVMTLLGYAVGDNV